ncbi:MAG: ribbon-helix-helix protein, CopG family [Alphaproteobacteria bacterium]|nr:ribbon-helix-helix protein, CopG family [Alphaproteobacteria bacterium]
MTVELDPTLAEQVREAAEASGLSADAFVRQALAACLADWDEDLRRLDEPGADVDAKDALDRFEAAVAEKLRARE